MERMFRQGIKKFPHSAKLHISFAFFYLEKMKNYTKAYCEFCLAETCSPSFVEQFIIYRFKKITSEGSQEEHYEEGNDE